MGNFEKVELSPATSEGLEKLQAYFESGAKFHGYLSPGLALGIFMVDLALEQLGPKDMVDAVVETKSCIPDAVQLMTSCTFGNGWMRVKDWGKMALTLYDKKEFDGVRVYVDYGKLEEYPLIRQWLMKKGDVDKNDVTREVIKAGRAIISFRHVKVDTFYRGKKTPPVTCFNCGETYPVEQGEMCARCSGADDYYQIRETMVDENGKPIMETSVAAINKAAVITP